MAFLFKDIKTIKRRFDVESCRMKTSTVLLYLMQGSILSDIRANDAKKKVNTVIDQDIIFNVQKHV